MKLINVCWVVVGVALMLCSPAWGAESNAETWSKLSAESKVAYITGFIGGVCYGGKKALEYQLEFSANCKPVRFAYSFVNDRCDAIQSEGGIKWAQYILNWAYQQEYYKNKGVHEILLSHDLWDLQGAPKEIIEKTLEAISKQLNKK